MKKLLSIILTITMFFSLATVSFADTPEVQNGDKYGTMGYWEYWEYESKQLNISSDPFTNWQVCYNGQPATRKGETQTASASLSATASISGTVKIPTGVINAELGFTIGGSYSVGGSTTSAPLDVGDYIIGYARIMANKSSVLQRKWIHMDGQNIKTSETATAYGHKPTSVSIKIEYYNSSSITNENMMDIESYTENNPYKVEYYEIDSKTNEFVLIYTDIL